MNAYLKPEVARALLAQSRAFTQAKRQERAENAANAELFALLARFGWTGHHASEMAEAHKRVQG